MIVAIVILACAVISLLGVVMGLWSRVAYLEALDVNTRDFMCKQLEYNKLIDKSLGTLEERSREVRK